MMSKRRKFCNNYVAEVECRCCHKVYKIPCDIRDLIDYFKNGKSIRILSYIPADLREMFISQTCPKCWDELFKDCE